MEEEVKKTSPFACRANDTIVSEKTKTASIGLGKYFLRQQDAAALDAMRRYTFLNAHMVSLVLARDLGFPKSAVKDLLARLTKNKLLARFRVHYTDAFGKEHMSSYVYCINDSTIKPDNIELNSRTAYSYLAFNQFHLAMSQIYQPALRNLVYMKGTSSEIDGVVSFTSQTKNVSLSVITIRNYQKGVTEKLQAVCNDPKHNNIIILCESELHALDIEKIRKQLDNAENQTVFYMTDYTTAKEEFPLQHLIRVLPGGREYEIVSIPVDGTTNLVTQKDEDE